jgi:hypothetical protein
VGKASRVTIKAGMNGQNGVATFAISVFHGWHETAFDLAVIRRVSHCNGARCNKLRSGD